MHHLQSSGFWFSSMQVWSKTSWRKNQSLKMSESWLSGMFLYYFLEHTSQPSVYSLLPVLRKQELMQRDWIRIFQQKVTLLKKKKKVVHRDDLTGLFLSWQVGLGTHNSLSRRQHDLAAFTEYVQDVCAAFRALVQNSHWPDGATAGFAHGLVNK